MTRDLQRSSTCSVDRGLYVLRYVSSDSADGPPVASVKAAPGSQDHVKFLNAPGIQGGVLRAPGDAMVVWSDAYAKVEITVRAADGSRVLDAKFAFEVLSKGSEVEDFIPTSGADTDLVASGPRTHPAPISASLSAIAPADRRIAAPVVLDVIAHVSRRGDVSVSPGEWIAGPKAPTPIEGIQIQCQGADLAISAQFMNTMQPGVWSAWWAAGDFVGSRQQASPLTGLRLKLVGRDAPRFEFEAEAMFLGLPLQRQGGSEITLATAGGSDLLVGLKLGLKSINRQEVPPTAKPPRVRVFRSEKADLVNS